MPIPDLETICVELTVTPQRLSVTFPGGASLDPELPDLGLPDPMQLSKQLPAQANAALAPLGPVFNLIDVALALFNAVKAIPDAISQILGTIGASDVTPGEVPWSEFGSLLYRLRHQKNDSVLQALARVYVVDALKRWEPRIVVTAVTVGREQHDGENVLAIRIRYDVISTNTPGNNVLLSGIDQTVRL